MVYVRSKKIGGGTYYYLVRSVREGDRVRQVIVQYLGSKEPGKEEVSKLKEAMKTLRKPRKKKRK
ncbi:MAG: hypothetical protein KAU03_04495 [Candidatus Altiarchaeales archaeon]|nr:hypothetical protein [Candidatus Altiarchaeales archaeon]